ncbi:Transcriptional regulatory protein KdpE [Anaerolineae bacterium]|nr:Transcriptional regulatory protein KdpE [Anaerolineae bacterium]
MTNPEHILVVDDEENLCAIIADALTSHGYQVRTASNPQDALRACEHDVFALALIDLKMPGPLDGIGLLTEIHKRWPQIIVIVMTGYGTLDSAIAALRQGAFDYLTKPARITQIIESTERGLTKRRDDLRRGKLIANLETTLSELKSHNSSGQTELAADRLIRTETLVIDRQKRLVVRDNQSLELTSTEFDLLEYLARNANRVVTARELVKVIQGYDLAEMDARPLVRVHIQRLRQKLEDDADNPRFILNVRGKGYRFVGGA